MVKVIKGEAYLKSVKYSDPGKQKERKELDVKESFIFIKGISYNYMRPSFDVTENVGPKFDSK